MRRERREGDGLDVVIAVCGKREVETTDDPGLVRCRLCRAAMQRADRAAEREAREAARLERERERFLEATNEAAQTIAMFASVDEPAAFEASAPVPVLEVLGATTIGPRELRIIERVRAGDDPDEGPRWRSLNAAISMWRRIGRDPSPIRSVPLERESRSEGAVRTTFGRDEYIEVDRAIDQAIPGPVRVRVNMHSLELSMLDARALLRSVFREEASATQIAADLTDAGRSANVELVSRVIQNARAVMQELLERKGLVPARPPRTSPVREESETMAAPYGFDLDGWKDILPLIGMSEKTARRMMERPNDPLPVKPWVNGVIAVRAEILAWVGRQTTLPRAASE